MMETETQSFSAKISGVMIQSMMNVSSGLYLIGQDASAFQTEARRFFTRKKVICYDTLEELSRDLRMLKIVVADDVTELSNPSVFLCLSTQVFAQVFMEVGKEFDVNGDNYYQSLALNCKRIFRYNGAEGLISGKDIQIHNGIVTGNLQEADIVLYTQFPESRDALDDWITMRNKTLFSKLISVEDFLKILSTNTLEPNRISSGARSGIFEGVTVFRENLPEHVTAYLAQEDAQLVGLEEQEFGLWSGHFEEESLLKLHLKESVICVSNSWILNAQTANHLPALRDHIMKIPAPPPFHAVNLKTFLNLLPHPDLPEDLKKVFSNLCKEMGINEARETGKAHGIIAPAFLSTPHTENRPTRNMYCLKFMFDNGPHQECPPHHLCYTLPESLPFSTDVSIVGVKAEKPLALFIKNLLKSTGVSIKSVEGEGTQVLLCDQSYIRGTLEKLRELADSGILVVNTDVIFAMLQKTQNCNLADYIVRFDAAPPEENSLIEIASSEPIADPDDPMNGSAAQKTNSAEILADIQASSQLSRPKSDSETGVEEFQMLMSYRERFAVHVVGKLIHSSLNLEIGRLTTLQLRSFPEFPGDPISLRITAKGEIQKMKTGVVTDFAGVLGLSDDSPIVGGLFYDVIPEHVQEWGLRLLAKLANMYSDLGFQNLFCHVNEKHTNGKDLVIVKDGERFLMASFRTEDDVTRPELFQTQFCAGIFFIPLRIVAPPLPIGFPHILVTCSETMDECFCSKPLDFSERLIVYSFHQLSNAPSHIQNSALLVLERNGEFRGLASLRKRSSRVAVIGKNSDDLVEKLTHLIQENSDGLKGEGTIFCNACHDGPNYARVCSVTDEPLSCSNCKAAMASGALVV